MNLKYNIKLVLFNKKFNILIVKQKITSIIKLGRYINCLSLQQQLRCKSDAKLNA